MSKPLVGVIGSTHLINDRHAAQRVGEKNLRALADVAEALPMMFAGAPDITDVESLLDVVDGIMLTGARANVHPSHFNTDPHPSHEPYDQKRDAVALQVARACVARGRMRTPPELTQGLEAGWPTAAPHSPHRGWLERG